MPIRKVDVLDSDIIDAYELISDGYTANSVYLNTACASTTALTKTIVMLLASDGNGILYSPDHQAEHGDIIWISGTSGGSGDGYFTINNIIDDTTFTVNETIGNSTGGNIQFRYISGASRVGFNSSGLPFIASNVQKAIESIVTNIKIDGIPAGIANTVNIITSGVLDASMINKTLTVSANKFILATDGSFVYIGDGEIVKAL